MHFARNLMRQRANWRLTSGPVEFRGAARQQPELDDSRTPGYAPSTHLHRSACNAAICPPREACALQVARMRRTIDVKD